MATSIKLDEGLKDRIKQLARSRDRSPHYLMREAIERYVDQEEARESFRREAEASWQAYQQDQRHLTFDELRDWLRTWGSDAPVEPPPCHD